MATSHAQNQGLWLDLCQEANLMPLRRRPDTIAEIDLALNDAYDHPLPDPADQEQWINALLDRRLAASEASCSTS